jgi:hypothetical protein
MHAGNSGLVSLFLLELNDSSPKSDPAFPDMLRAKKMRF